MAEQIEPGGCDCNEIVPKGDDDRKVLRIALLLNSLMFVVGTFVGIRSQSTGVLADALDMLCDAAAYGLALAAFQKGQQFKRSIARWIGGTLLLLGGVILIEVLRRWVYGSEPVGAAMMVYSVVSFVVNLFVLIKLAKFKNGEIHLRASYICTRADVIANIAVFISGALVMATGLKVLDLVVGLAIGVYVFKEALEIFRDTTDDGMVP